VVEKEEIICYKKVQAENRPCCEKKCRNYLKSERHLNCAILAAREGPMTLQEIGDIFGVSRMRICQIEKSILEKIKKTNKDISSF
jgi:DNA-directed RNA polymerase sigma subunit (sigma70/sigma32)